MSNIAFAKIFPAIGIARLGDSEAEDGWFYGPEWGLGRSSRPADFKYRDAAGRIKRQAARFRIYGFNKNGEVVKELTDEDADITWRVHLANKKAAWFAYDGTSNALAQFRGLKDAAKLELRNADVGAMEHHGGRYVPDRVRREHLGIDGGAKQITGRDSKPETGPKGDGYRFIGSFKQRRSVYLGELRTDGRGRLIVLGGTGSSDAVDADGNSIRAQRWITNYANNDDWHDDVSDGPVSAQVALKGGKEIAVQGGAWVVVAPPDFAPDVQNLITLYDVMEETALYHELDCGPDAPRLRGSDLVDYEYDIVPILARLNDYRWVNAMGLRGHGFAKPGEARYAEDPTLGDPESSGGEQRRRHFFEMLRKPIYDLGRRGEKHDETLALKQANAFYMPPLSGDEGDREVGNPATWLTLSHLQYRRMQEWANSRFKAAGAGPEYLSGERPQVAGQPARLTQVALEAGAGGAFFPGIEMTAVIREPKLYVEAFRFNHETIGAGDVTKFMACPWQADFYECRDAWWPAQRPDDVISEEAFDEIFANFTEEKTGSFEGEFERVLFNRVRWDRGLDQKPRPSGDYLADRLLPDPGRSSSDAYATGRGQEIADWLLDGTIVADYEDFASSDWPRHSSGDRIASPWRVQFLVQGQLDRFSARYFHPVAPRPEDVIKLHSIAVPKKTKPPVRTLAELQRDWGAIRTVHPAYAARVVGVYCADVRRQLRADLVQIFAGHPQARTSARALRDWLLDENNTPDQVQIRHPEDFETTSDAAKQLRAAELVDCITDLLYLRHSVEAPDMAMVDEWRHQGFVIERDIPLKDDQGNAVTISAKIETERDKYRGGPFRDYFYILMNVDKFPDFAGYAKLIADTEFDAAQKLIDKKGISDPSHPESYVPYTAENFGAKLEEIYEILRARSLAATIPWDATRKGTIREILDRAPFNQTDGAWLRHVGEVGPSNEENALLFEVWSDEVGNGDPSLNHSNLYTSLLESLGQKLPPINSRSYADNPAIHETEFTAPVFQLAVSLHSEQYLPEILGMTLFLEWEVLSLVPRIKTMDYLGIDTQFWRMHVGIDNATDGHGAKAKRAVELYLDRVMKESGLAAQQYDWRRIWRGFVAFAAAGNEYFQSDGDDMGDELVNRRRPGTPQDRVTEIMARKRHYGSLNHLRKQIGAHRINDLFEDPRVFVEELASSSWIVPGDPDNSRFMNYLTSYSGPMYKVFDDADRAAWREWILWLGREGDTATLKRQITKAEAMLILLTLLREQARGTDGHRLFKLRNAKSPERTQGRGEEAAPPSVAEFFAVADLRELMRALRDAKNGWIVPFRPEESPLLVDRARGGCPMGVVLDKIYPELGNVSGRLVLAEWIASGCRLPEEPTPPRHERVLPRRPRRPLLLMEQWGYGAVH